MLSTKNAVVDRHNSRILGCCLLPEGKRQQLQYQERLGLL